MKNTLKLSAVALCVALTTACSGGSSGSPSAQTQSAVNYGDVVIVDQIIRPINANDIDRYNWRHFKIDDEIAVDLAKMSNNNRQGTFKGKFDNGAQYLIGNQAYSSYGILRYNGHNYFIEEGAPTTFESTPQYKEHYTIGTIRNGVEELYPHLHGTAIYKGNVIKSEKGWPSQDGTITLNVDFARTLDRSTISGVINSKSHGRIELLPTDLTNSQRHYHNLTGMGSHTVTEEGGEERVIYDQLKFIGKASLPQGSGAYYGTFYGPHLNDVVGTVASENTNYNAAFGATKQ